MGITDAVGVTNPLPKEVRMTLCVALRQRLAPPLSRKVAARPAIEGRAAIPSSLVPGRRYPSCFGCSRKRDNCGATYAHELNRKDRPVAARAKITDVIARRSEG